MLMVMACEVHSDEVVSALESAGIQDWSVTNCSQASRSGQLAIDPPRSYTAGRVLLATGSADQVSRAVSLVSQAVSADEVCKNCRMYTWDVQSVSLGALVADPVCGMMVEPANALSLSHSGREYWFCCEDCRNSFKNDPGAYMHGTQSRRAE